MLIQYNMSWIVSKTEMKPYKESESATWCVSYNKLSLLYHINSGPLSSCLGLQVDWSTSTAVDNTDVIMIRVSFNQCKQDIFWRPRLEVSRRRPSTAVLKPPVSFFRKRSRLHLLKRTHDHNYVHVADHSALFTNVRNADFGTCWLLVVTVSIYFSVCAYKLLCWLCFW